MSFSVAPGFLVAMPSLHDPNFDRSVVLLCAHSEDGAFGLVVNRPLGITMSAVCAESKIEWTGDEDATAFVGGPVEPHRGWLLHGDEHLYPQTQSVFDGIAVTTSQDGLVGFGQNPEGRFRLVLGYAGWGAGQLDQEIAAGAWLTAPIDASIVFDTSVDRIWHLAMRSVGIDPAHLVEAAAQLH